MATNINAGIECAPLYKIDSNGNILVWEIWTSKGSVHTRHGRLDGQQQHDYYLAEAKNIGKANFRDEETQAIEEAKSKWEKQVKYNQYFISIDEAKASTKTIMPSGGIKPMKAHKWEDYKHKLEYPLYVQPKIDGQRCIAVCIKTTDGRNEVLIELYSSSGRPINGLMHIKRELVGIMEPGEIWDGELYKYGMPLNQILSITRSEVNPKNIKLQEQIKYYVFDAIQICSQDKFSPFTQRYVALYNRLIAYNRTHVKGVITHLVINENEANEYYMKFIEQGYEGIMYRMRNMIYENVKKRSYEIQKRKGFQEEEFKILDVIEGKGRAAGLAVNFKCQLPNGETFDPSINGTEAYRIELFNNHKLWKNKYATVRFLNYSEYGVPVIPKVVAIRNEVGLD